jgi:hypothetical protein
MQSMSRAAFSPELKRRCLAACGALWPAAIYLSAIVLTLLVGASAVDRLLLVAATRVTASPPPPIADATPPAAVFVPSSRPHRAQSLVEVRVASMRPTNDEWTARITDPAYWARRRGAAADHRTPSAFGRPGRLGAQSQIGPEPGAWFWWTSPFDAPPPARTRETWNTYRTVCVRLCDGFYIPLSFATTRDKFGADVQRCENTCGSQARLFVYRNPGADIHEMEDLDGKPYKRLATAFKYRSGFDETCKCRPHAWEEAARDRHKLYALEAARAKGDRVAGREAEALARKLRQAEVETSVGEAVVARPRQKRNRQVQAAPPAVDSANERAALPEPVAAAALARRTSLGGPATAQSAARTQAPPRQPTAHRATAHWSRSVFGQSH